MAVTLLLTSLLLPALSQLRENAHRVVCSSNLRQTGLAVVMWVDDHGTLPETTYGAIGKNKQEMMVAHGGSDVRDWEGLGWLFAKRYIEAPEVFYCPSHRGDHAYSTYAGLYFSYRHTNETGPAIYTNYHYMGNFDWTDGTPRTLAKDPSLVIATDGLRTRRDYNHETGINVLRGDSSVLWREDPDTRRMMQLLPAGADDSGSGVYQEIWKIVTAGSA